MDAWNIGGFAMGLTDKTVKDPGTSLLAVLYDAIKVPIWISFSVARLTLRSRLVISSLTSINERCE